MEVSDIIVFGDISEDIILIFPFDGFISVINIDIRVICDRNDSILSTLCHVDVACACFLECGCGVSEGVLVGFSTDGWVLELGKYDDAVSLGVSAECEGMRIRFAVRPCFFKLLGCEVWYLECDDFIRFAFSGCAGFKFG